MNNLYYSPEDDCLYEAVRVQKQRRGPALYVMVSNNHMLKTARTLGFFKRRYFMVQVA